MKVELVLRLGELRLVATLVKVELVIRLGELRLVVTLVKVELVLRLGELRLVVTLVKVELVIRLGELGLVDVRMAEMVEVEPNKFCYSSPAMSVLNDTCAWTTCQDLNKIGAQRNSTIRSRLTTAGRIWTVLATPSRVSAVVNEHASI